MTILIPKGVVIKTKENPSLVLQERGETYDRINQ